MVDTSSPVSSYQKKRATSNTQSMVHRCVLLCERSHNHSNRQSTTTQTNMNSAYRIPTPPDMIAASMMSLSFEDSSYDASSFAPPATDSFASSYGSYSSQESASSCISKSQVGGLSRSRCISNLSALGGNASETSIPRQAFYKSGPNKGWGYYVDTPSR